MHIITVNNFLCCFKLETGGFLLGWLGTIVSTFAVALFATAIVLTTINFNQIQELVTSQIQFEVQTWPVHVVLDTQTG